MPVPDPLLQLVFFGAAFTGLSTVFAKSPGVAELRRVAPVGRRALPLGRVLRDAVVLAPQAGRPAVPLVSPPYALAMEAGTPREFAPVVNTTTGAPHAAPRAGPVDVPCPGPAGRAGCPTRCRSAVRWTRSRTRTSAPARRRTCGTGP
ncbi:hypothetical protein ABZX69_34525 [Streptomyces sp. NPDC004074]|uniref:hypothetical protein n=1 Tax=Streptomyces sp. NPDC004074 TaxID=3154277 RepID=UPI0033AE1AF9